jgi:3-oxoacyl-[acyl-carrier-protein] synthase-3
MSPKFKNPRAKFNFQGRSCSITGVGSYLPAKILTNAHLEKMVDTSDEWITTRTGIKSRRQAAKDEFTSDMAAHAARRAMKMAGVTADQIDLIIVATITPDMPFPATACLVQQKIGARRAAAFDVEAACSGFIYALEIGQQFIMSRTWTRCWSSARKNFRPLRIGRTATPACCSATARARRFCRAGPVRTGC